MFISCQVYTAGEALFGAVFEKENSNLPKSLNDN